MLYGDLEDEDDDELPPALPPPLVPEDIPLSPLPPSTEYVHTTLATRYPHLYIFL